MKNKVASIEIILNGCKDCIFKGESDWKGDDRPICQITSQTEFEWNDDNYEFEYKNPVHIDNKYLESNNKSPKWCPLKLLTLCSIVRDGNNNIIFKSKLTNKIT